MDWCLYSTILVSMTTESSFIGQVTFKYSHIGGMTPTLHGLSAQPGFPTIHVHSLMIQHQGFSIFPKDTFTYRQEHPTRPALSLSHSGSLQIHNSVNQCIIFFPECSFLIFDQTTPIAQQSQESQASAVFESSRSTAAVLDEPQSKCIKHSGRTAAVQEREQPAHVSWCVYGFGSR